MNERVAHFKIKYHYDLDVRRGTKTIKMMGGRCCSDDWLTLQRNDFSAVELHPIRTGPAVCWMNKMPVNPVKHKLQLKYVLAGEKARNQVPIYHS